LLRCVVVTRCYVYVVRYVTLLPVYLAVVAVALLRLRLYLPLFGCCCGYGCSCDLPYVVTHVDLFVGWLPVVVGLPVAPLLPR